MQGKGTTNSTFFQLLEPFFSPKFQNLLQSLEVDKYVKKLTAYKFIILIILSQLEEYTCLREISNSLHSQELNQAVELPSISASQVSRKLRSLPLPAVKSLFRDMVQKAGRQMGFPSIMKNLGRLYLIDSSVISLSLSRYLWADFRKTKSGIKLHLRLRLYEGGVLPDAAIITKARMADKTQMDQLVVEEKGAFNVFDRAYVDYKKFDDYCENGIYFASRLKRNALAEVQEEYPVNPGPIQRDCKVLLGKDGVSKMKNPLRLIEATDTEGKPVIIITNNFILSAEEIGDIYRYRWQIEIFFKWMKQHMRVKHFYGYSRQAVELQLYIALITYCMLVLIQRKTGYEGPLLTLKRLLNTTCLYEPFASFVLKLHHKPKRSSRGRRRTNYQQIFEETVEQVMAGEADHLDDLTYDPVIL